MITYQRVGDNALYPFVPVRFFLTFISRESGINNRILGLRNIKLETYFCPLGIVLPLRYH